MKTNCKNDLKQIYQTRLITKLGVGNVTLHVDHDEYSFLLDAHIIFFFT